jgi:uncharacterized protein (DUF1778 family)
MAGTTMTIRLSEDDKGLITAYARIFGQSVSEFMRESALEKIEDAIDLKDWETAKQEFEENPVTHSAAEMADKYL